MRKFTHDCKECKYLGSDEEFDFYYCAQGGHFPTLVARYGNEGPEYTSGLDLSELIPALGKAKKLAQDQGFISGDD